MSTLTAFAYIPERAEAVPALWNTIFSIQSDNIRTAAEGPFTSESGDTLSVSTNLELTGGGHFQFLSVGSTPPSEVTTAAITIGVDSAYSDHLYLTDSSGARSNYVIGSRAGGTADGLNIWDSSGDTMIVSFSKQSVRFYQNVVGPVFDVGGALADTLNAATFGTGADSDESRIQAAIDAASAGGISRVYVPANMYPYSASSMSFIHSVQIVREGGDWSVYDVRAYGAFGDGTRSDKSAFVGAIAGAHANNGDIVFVPGGTYLTESAISVLDHIELVGVGFPSLIRGTTAGQFIFDLNPARRAHIAMLRFDSSVVQTSTGGAIDFTNAGANARFDNLWFGNKLYTSLNVTPAVSAFGGIYFFDRLRWDVVSDCSFGIVLGNNSALLADIRFANVVGTASSSTGMYTWIQANNRTDTMVLENVLFYQGKNGIVIGTTTPPYAVTGAKMSDVVVDSMSTTGAGIQITNCRDLVAVNTSVQIIAGDGIRLGQYARDAAFIGGTIQANGLNGFAADTGATRWSVIGMGIQANNTTNTASTHGIAVGSGISDWRVSNCHIGNIGLSGGHQKYGISIAAGTGHTYTITDNTFIDNETGAINDLIGSATRRGNKLSIGSQQGRAVLISGTTTVSTSEIQTADNVHLTPVAVGGIQGMLTVGTITAGTSFVIDSSSGTDTSTIFWEIVH